MKNSSKTGKVSPKSGDKNKSHKISVSNSQRSKKNSHHFSSLQETSKINKRLLKQIKASTRMLYDRVYEEKLKSHFSVPYPKFPYNLDKDTIFLEEQKSCKLWYQNVNTIKCNLFIVHTKNHSRQRKASAHTKIGKTTTTVVQNDHEFYRTNRTAKFFRIKSNLGENRANSSKRTASWMLWNYLNKDWICIKPGQNTATSFRDEKSTNIHSRSVASELKNVQKHATVMSGSYKETPIMVFLL